MPFVPVPNTVEVDVIFELDGQRVENVHYYEFATDPGTAEVADLLSTLRALIETELMPLLSSALTLVELVGTLLTAIDSFSISNVVTPPVAGGNSTQALPNNVSYTITKQTALRGRSFRGRNYVVGMTEDAVNLNTINPTFRADLLSVWEQLRTVPQGDGWTQVVVSRFANGAPRATGVTTPVTSVTTFDATVDSQRRRLSGRGA